jgi:hypothetical protein
MREKRKDPKPKYGFLFDRDVSKSASFFPAKRRWTMEQVGLPQNATDAEIVRKASDLGLTIVTANGDDFVKEFEKFLRQAKQTECHDMSGLVILPNGYENQRRSLKGIEKKLRLDGHKISWAVVADKDCWVRVKKEGSPEVDRFPRCFYCQKRGYT